MQAIPAAKAPCSYVHSGHELRVRQVGTKIAQPKITGEQAARLGDRQMQRAQYDVHLAIACPMANEGATAVPFVKAVLDACEPVRHVTFFAVVDDASRDNTVKVLRDHAT